MANKIVKYQVIREDEISVGTFEGVINKLIAEGWVPQGGVAMSDTNSLVQAMVKYA